MLEGCFSAGGRSCDLGVFTCNKIDILVFLDFETEAWSGVELDDAGLLLGCSDLVHLFGVFSDFKQVV